MKRKDIISKLINEGFSQKTLVNMTDKQLRVLGERILGEQYSTPTTAPVLNIPKSDASKIQDAKNKKQVFSTYESEVTEDYGKSTKKEEDKKLTMKRLKHKIEHCVDEGKLKDYIRLVKKLNDGKVPNDIKTILDKKEEKVPVSETKKWVNKIVENRFFTSKNDIMDLIQQKLNEQWEEEDIDVIDAPSFGSTEKEIETKPTTKPAEPTTDPGIDPDDPFRDPMPNVNPNPKAIDKNEISAEVAKDKILDLMQKML